jgi:hypothetical protein
MAKACKLKAKSPKGLGTHNKVIKRLPKVLESLGSGVLE